MSPSFLIAIGSLGCLTLAACSPASDQARSAASIGGWPACSEGFAAECVVAIPAADPVNVSNDTTVVLIQQESPVDGLAVTRTCWSGEDDTEATTCASANEPIPDWIAVEPTTVMSKGTAWPALSIRVFETVDSAGEEFMPLPATIDLTVNAGSINATVSLEVACCDPVRAK